MKSSTTSYAVAPPEASAAQSAFDEHQKAYFGAAALAFLWILVGLITLVEKPVFGAQQLSGGSFIDFTIGALALIAYFLVLANRDGPRVLQGLLVQAIGPDSCAPTVLETPTSAVRQPGRILSNPWVPVTLEFLLVGWLIYASGGVVGGPYAPVPFGMIFIGQSVYDVRPIAMSDAPSLGALFVFAARVAAQYWYPLSLSVFLVVSLELAQQVHPLVSHSIAPGEFAFTALLSLFVGMCATYATRCADRGVRRDATRNRA